MATTGISKGACHFDVASGPFKGHFGALTWPQYFEEILGPKKKKNKQESSLRKYDKLCVTMEVHNPDMICIVETAMCQYTQCIVRLPYLNIKYIGEK